MNNFGFKRHALSGFACVVLLAGCGGSQVPITATDTSQNAAMGNESLTYDAVATYAHNRTFHYAGKRQMFKVPSGVTQIRMIGIGGEGGGEPASHGGRVSAVIPVIAGQLLYVRVGGNGTSTIGGYNGGGAPGSFKHHSDGFGGGGSSDVRLDGDSLNDRIFVVGGGGGQGGFNGNGNPNGVGGKGGALSGGSGADGGGYYGGLGGGGGTQSSGGGGGSGGNGGSCSGGSGAAGSFENGGAGGSVHSGRSNYPCGGLGGGGGAGYYGGGGGGASGATSSYYGGGGGGGGGSSFVEATATNVHMWQGWKRNFNGLIVFDW